MHEKLNPNLASIAKTASHAFVYEPSDDSFLLADVLATHLKTDECRPNLCVEIGCGSGYVICSVARLLAYANARAHCIAVDINPHAVDCTARTLDNHELKSADLVVCNLLDPMLEHLHKKVDLLVFNPPYVPTPVEETEHVGIAQAWAGGHMGRSVTDKILPQISQLLTANGCCFLVAVAENDPEGMIREMSHRGLQEGSWKNKFYLAGAVVASRQADEESLCVIKLSHRRSH